MTISRRGAFSDVGIPPGDILGEERAVIGMTRQERAGGLDRPPQVVNEISRGE